MIIKNSSLISTDKSKSLLTGMMVWLLLMLLAGSVLAHETSMTRIEINLENNMPARMDVEIDVIDIELALGLDADRDGTIYWGEYQDRSAAIADYIQQRLDIATENGSCTYSMLPDNSGVRAGEQAAVVMAFVMECPKSVSALTINNRLLTDIDNNARVLLEVNGGIRNVSASLGSGATEIPLESDNPFSTAFTFTIQGIHHILIGIDHLAFLMVLLVPVARVGRFRSRLLSITGIVTAFTLAHSVTLTLASTSRLQLPIAPVEIVIAASIVFAAIVNLVKPRHRVGWLMAYVFGLIHGFGFASALSDLEIAENLQLINLVCFNVGVELGQLAVIVIALPVLSVMGNALQFRRYLQPGFSILIAIAGTYWMVTRIIENIPVMQITG